MVGSCAPVSGSLANSVTRWLRPSPSSQREEQEERLGANAQLSECTHRARVGRVSTGLGEHCLVRRLLSCSIANPGLREESQAIADSWVVTEQTPRAQPGPGAL